LRGDLPLARHVLGKPARGKLEMMREGSKRIAGIFLLPLSQLLE